MNDLLEIDKVVARMDRKPWLAVEESSVVVKRGSHRQTIVKLFKDRKFRWTANGLCPVWLVPESHEEVI